MSGGKLTRMCSHCEAALPSAAKFCPDCGFPVGGGAPGLGEARAFVANTAYEAGKSARGLMKNEDAQKIAGAAAAGAVAAVVLPVSMATGALIGAGIMAYKRFVK